MILFLHSLSRTYFRSLYESCFQRF